jgi:predicted nuclease with TOPRIM domain
MKNRKLKLISLTVICLIFISLLSAGFSGDSTKLQKQLDEVKTNYTALQSDFEQVSKDNDDLKSKYEGSLEKLESVKSELTAYQEQQTQIDELNKQVTDLQAQKDSVIAENNSLKAQLASQQTETPAPSVEASTVPDNVNDEVSWLSATGSKYHSIPDCGNMNPNNASQTTVSSAEASGYGRCSKCW